MACHRVWLDINLRRYHWEWKVPQITYWRSNHEYWWCRQEKSGQRICLKKDSISYSHTHNQQQTSISSQLIVTEIHHALFDQCTFPGLSKVESSGHTAYINGQMQRNLPKIQPQVHFFNIPGTGVTFWYCGWFDLAITSRILKSITLNSNYWWMFLS